jgi:hypothetical protein
VPYQSAVRSVVPGDGRLGFVISLELQRADCFVIVKGRSLDNLQ